MIILIYSFFIYFSKKYIESVAYIHHLQTKGPITERSHDLVYNDALDSILCHRNKMLFSLICLTGLSRLGTESKT